MFVMVLNPVKIGLIIGCAPFTIRQMINPTGIIAGLQRLLSASGARNAFFANLFIGGALALLVYFVEQTGMVEHLLNRLLFMILVAIGGVLHYSQFSSFTLEGVVLDAASVVVAVAIWTWFRTLKARILLNLLVLAALIPLTMVLYDRNGILLSGVPIVLVIIVAILMDAATDMARNRFRRRITEEKQEAEYSVIRHLAHNVKPGLQIVRSPLFALQDLLDKRGLLSAELSRRLDGSTETVGEALNNAIASLGQINDIIDHTRQLVTREISCEMFREVELKELLEREVFPLHAGKFGMVVDGGPVKVLLHRESFVEAINNLLRNAKTHGFPNLAASDEIRFSLRQTRKRIIIDYTNNGRPFPANLSAQEFLSFGAKGADSPGEGLGGAWIGKVIEAHGGGFEIIRDGHPVHFRITLLKRRN
ncbi:MAG: ATP-binding protein [Pedobacter sp.]